MASQRSFPIDLVSPLGVLNIIHTAAGLAEFEEEYSALGRRNVAVLTGELMGSGDKLHVHFWQRRVDLHWLEPVGGGTAVPYLGGPGRYAVDHFLRLVADGHFDAIPSTTLFKKSSLQDMFKRPPKQSSHAGWKRSTTPAYTRESWPVDKRREWGKPPTHARLPDYALNPLGAVGANVAAPPAELVAEVRRVPLALPLPSHAAALPLATASTFATCRPLTRVSLWSPSAGRWYRLEKRHSRSS